MIIEKIQTDGRTRLKNSLETLTRSFSKRGVSFAITAHSEFVATIIMLVTGKQGTAQKTIVIVYNQATLDWEGFCDGYIFKMLALSEISTVIKSKIQTLSVLLLKM